MTTRRAIGGHPFAEASGRTRLQLSLLCVFYFRTANVRLLVLSIFFGFFIFFVAFFAGIVSPLTKFRPAGWPGA
jgi:hypothetical protein